MFVGVWCFKRGIVGRFLGIKKEPYSAQGVLFIEMKNDDFKVVLETCGVEKRGGRKGVCMCVVVVMVILFFLLDLKF